VASHLARALIVVTATLVALAPVPARADKDDKKPQVLRTTEMCIDKEIADRLSIKRKRRGVVDRLYVKQNRHEFTARGGYFISDLYSSTYIAGAAYTYHMTETSAVEFGFAWTHQDADTIRAIEGGRGTVLDDEFARTLFAESVLVFTPVYGKFRLGGQVMRFDMHVDVGVGVTDSETSRGVSGVGGLGFKLFLGQPVALRFDFRDRVYQQELLDENFIVNDLSITAGLSLFLPLRN
jgi:outer membrane beta-barrel protein